MVERLVAKSQPTLKSNLILMLLLKRKSSGILKFCISKLLLDFDIDLEKAKHNLVQNALMGGWAVCFHNTDGFIST